MKILVAGDTHGNTEFAMRHAINAREFGISHVVIVGDFGLWDHELDGVQFLDDLSEVAARNHLNFYAIGGNHENWDNWNWYVENAPKDKRGFAYVRRHVLLAPKAHKWKWDGKQFICAGGAVSVDAENRRLMEKGYDIWRGRFNRSKAPGPRTMWWPNEQLTDEDVREIVSWHRTADYLFTHDCSNSTPWKNRLKDDPESQIHRQRIDRVIQATKPFMHFHGHMHEQYQWINSLRVDQSDEYPEGWHDVETFGLEHNKRLNSWGVLDTQTDEFLWQGVHHPEIERPWEEGLHGLVDDVEQTLDRDEPVTGTLIQAIKRVGEGQ